MFYLYLGVYTIFVIVIWWFYAVARIHAYKFKSFSSHITIVIRSLFVILTTLTILWYIIIFSTWDIIGKKVKLDIKTNKILEEQSY